MDDLEISRGRLIRTSDGILKEVELKHGGGSRFCPWNDKGMDFQIVHRMIIQKFELNDCKYKTQLYDFNQRVLDINAYENFAQYVERFGLNTNSTILYLCTIESFAHKNESPTKTKDTIVTTITSSEPHKADTNQQQTQKSPLIDLLNTRDSTIFRESIFSAIADIKCMHLNVNLHDEQSLNDVKRKIVSIENKINQILDEQGVNNFNIELNQQIDGSCRKALKTIESLLVILNRYQMQVQQTNRNKYSRWSSPPRLFNETRQSMPPKKQK
ncbi:unnamed protein product [Rotaria magnacalcarata]|uniref:Uncharacterized protein n=1 Tax=Rotaria magnacalcarata TaxID=392030 RepID=A0A8S2KEM1_9BILA|nr:unnamed protein product [Rotaria magnacalcarata]CAF4154955.1 unnamed protein product [Rotaria magnacalcarata]